MTTPWQPGNQGVTVVPPGYNDPHNWSPSSALQVVASTPPAGVALVNGTPTILSWTAPADQRLHQVIFFSWLNVASTETGGQVNATYSGPTGGVITAQLFAAALAGPGVFLGSALAVPVGSGQTVTVAQGTALTAGASTVYAVIWGA